MLRRSMKWRGGGKKEKDKLASASGRVDATEKQVNDATHLITEDAAPVADMNLLAEHAGEKRRRRSVPGSVDTSSSKGADGKTSRSMSSGGPGRSGSSKKSKNRETRQPQQPPQANDGIPSGRYSREGSYGSGGTSSTASLSSDSPSNSPGLDETELKIERAQHLKQQKEQQSNCRPPAILSSPRTPTQLSPKDDDESIARLESECARLSMAMSKLRKYTPEWFLLETRLANAKDELDAAKEDLDLHFYLGGHESPIEAGSPKLDESGNRRCSEVSSDIIGANTGDSARVGVPEAVFLGDLDEPPALGTAKEVAVTTKPRPAPIDTELNYRSGIQQDEGANPAEGNALRMEIERMEKELKKLPKFTPEWFSMKEDLVELNIALDEGEEVVPPPLEKPKEIVVHSSSGLRRKKPDRLFLPSPKKDAKGRGTKNGVRETRKKDKKEKKTRKRKERKNNHPASPPIRFRPISPTQQQARSPSPIVRGSLSPYPKSSGSNSNASHGNCLSPYHSISSEGGGAPHRNNLAHNYCYSNFDDDDQHSSREYDTTVAIADLIQQRARANEELGRTPQYSKEWFDVKTRIMGLQDQIDELENDFSDRSSGGSSGNLRNRSMISGWSSVMSESEEEIMSFADDMECLMVVEALKHQRQCEDDDHCLEQELNSSSIDDSDLLLETSQISEDERELRQVQLEKQRIVSSVMRIQTFVRCRQQLHRYRKERENAKVIQSFLRKTHARSNFLRLLLAVVGIQCLWRCHRAKKSTEAARAVKAEKERVEKAERDRAEKAAQAEKAEKERAVKAAKEREERLKKEASQFDMMLDDLALMIGDEEEDDFDKETYNALIIEGQWYNYRACKSLISLRKRAQAYRGIIHDEALRRNRFEIFSALVRGDKKQEEEQDRVTWHKFAAVYLQAVWKKYQARKRFLLIRESAAKIQALVRSRQQSRRYAQEREKAIVIQSFLRQKQAASHLQLALSSILVIQRLWRKALSTRPPNYVTKNASKLQAMVRSHQQRCRYDQQREKVICIQSFLRTSWVATGQLYTDQREVIFYSTVMGIRLHRGKDGFVRVLSSATDEATTTIISSFVLDGTVEPGDLVLEAAGVKLRSPITKDEWGETVQGIRNAPRPMKFILASGTGRLKSQLSNDCKVVSMQLRSLVSAVRIQREWRERYLLVKERAEKIRASITIQRSVRQWMARCLHARQLEREMLLAEFDAILFQLQRLRVATVLQSYARRWRAQSSFSLKRKSTIRIQSCIRMNAERSQYKQTQSNVVRIQGFVRAWLYMRNQAAAAVQSHVRRWLAQATFSRQRESSIRIQASIRMAILRCMLIRQNQAATVLQSHARKLPAQSSFSRKRESSIHIQASSRMVAQRRKFTQALTNVVLIQSFVRTQLIRRTQAATVLQSHARRWLAHSSYSLKREASICIQSFVRMHAERRHYRQAMTNLVLIQGYIRVWLIRREHAAIVIQACVRRFLIRRMDKKALHFYLLRKQVQNRTNNRQQKRTNKDIKRVGNFAFLRKQMQEREHRTGQSDETQSPEKGGSSFRSPVKPAGNFALLRKQLEQAAKERDQRAGQNSGALPSSAEGSASHAPVRSSGNFALLRKQLERAAQERDHRKGPITAPSSTEKGGSSRAPAKSSGHFALLRKFVQERQQHTSTGEASPSKPGPPAMVPVAMQLKNEATARKQPEETSQEVMQHDSTSEITPLKSGPPPMVPVATQTKNEALAKKQPVQPAQERHQDDLTSEASLSEGGRPGPQVEVPVKSKPKNEAFASLRQKLEARSSSRRLPPPEQKKVARSVPHATGFASLRQSLEAHSSTPIFPHDVKPQKKLPAAQPNQHPVPAPEAHAGEKWSPKTELRNVHVADYKKNLYGVESSMSSTAAVESSKMEETKRKKKKKPASEEEMKKLTTELLRLASLVQTLPKNSPEWTLANVELKYISDELEFLQKQATV